MNKNKEKLKIIKMRRLDMIETISALMFRFYSVEELEELFKKLLENIKKEIKK